MTNKLKNKVIILPISTEKEILNTEKVQQRLYAQFNSVYITTYGLDKIKIIAFN